MATWLKVVLIAGAVCIVGTIGLVVAGIMFGSQMFSQMTSPAKIKEVANVFMQIADPLPAGYNYTAGANIGTPFVVIMTPDKKVIITFFVDPGSPTSGASPTPQATIDSIANGTSTATAPGTTAPRKLTKVSKATVQVGGQTMPYVIGHAEKPSDTSDVANTFFGAAKSPTTGKIIFVMAQSLDATSSPAPLTLDKVTGLTNAIKSFN